MTNVTEQNSLKGYGMDVTPYLEVEHYGSVYITGIEK